MLCNHKDDLSNWKMPHASIGPMERQVKELFHWIVPHQTQTITIPPTPYLIKHHATISSVDFLSNYTKEKFKLKDTFFHA